MQQEATFSDRDARMQRIQLPAGADALSYLCSIYTKVVWMRAQTRAHNTQDD